MLSFLFYEKRTQMTLCFCNTGDNIIVEIFDESGQKVAEKSQEKTTEREDLLREIVFLLKKIKISANEVQRIIMIPGAGRFTAVRSACLIANIFAAETGAKILPVSADDFEKSGSDFSQWIHHEIPAQDRVEPIFLGKLRIGKKKQ